MRLFLLLLLTPLLSAQSLPIRWEELNASQFLQGIRQSQGVCILPFGIIEKHGPHLPLGTDLINVRYTSLAAAHEEYAIVFTEYYFGQIFEAKHEPGTIAYSARLQLDLLQETVDEMARNGCKKIIIANGHGGNTNFLQYFAQAQLAQPRDYVVYVHLRAPIPTGGPVKKTTNDGHAGESETSRTLISRPDLVKMDKAAEESGADRNRQDLPQGLYTGIWWYAKYPDHYAGDGTAATRELGEFEAKAAIAALVNTIKAVKADRITPRLQQEFFEKARHPIDTRQ